MKVQKIVWVCSVAALLAGGCGQSESRGAKRGLKAIKQQRFDDAVESFEALINKYPEHEDQAEWNNQLGVALWNLNRPEEANNAFHRSREINPDYFEPAYNLGVLFMRAGDLYQGATLLEDAALIREDGTLALEMLAAEYLKQSEWGKARDVLQKAQKRAPESPRVLTYLAMAGLHDEGAGFTESYLERALELDPRYAPALFNLGILYEKWHKQADKAVEYYDQYLKVESDHVRRSLVKHTVDKLKATIEPEVQVPTEVEPTHNPMQPEVAKKEEPVVEDPNVDPVEREVEMLLARAMKEIRAGSTDRSLNYCLQAAAVASSRNRADLQLKALKSAVSLNPKQGRSHFALGRFYHGQKDFKNAVESFSQAVEFIPNWPAGLLALAESASAGHEYQTALSALRKAVRADMGNADSLWALAEFYDNDLKLPERALEHYRLFAQRFPEDKRSNKAVDEVEKLEKSDAGNVGFDAVAIKTVKPVEQTHTLTAVNPVASTGAAKVSTPRPGFRTLTPKVPSAETPKPPLASGETMAVTRDGRRVRAKAIDLFNQGTVYQKSNQFEQAIALYGKSIETDGTYAPAHYNLGVILQRQNKLQGAIDSYSEALALNPGLVNARYNLGFIYKDLQQHEKAIKELNLVLKENRNHAPSYYALGLIYSSRGNVQLAKFNYENFIRLAPTDPAAPRVKRWISMH